MCPAHSYFSFPWNLNTVKFRMIKCLTLILIFKNRRLIDCFPIFNYSNEFLSSMYNYEILCKENLSITISLYQFAI